MIKKFTVVPDLIENSKTKWHQYSWRNNTAAKSKGEKYYNDIFYKLNDKYAIIKMYMDTNNRHVCYILVPDTKRLLEFLYDLEQCTWVPSQNVSLGIKTGKLDDRKHFSLSNLLKKHKCSENQILIIRDWKSKN